MRDQVTTHETDQQTDCARDAMKILADTVTSNDGLKARMLPVYVRKTIDHVKTISGGNPEFATDIMSSALCILIGARMLGASVQGTSDEDIHKALSAGLSDLHREIEAIAFDTNARTALAIKQDINDEHHNS